MEVTFENLEDITKFEDRIEVLNLNISSKVQNEDVISYCLIGADYITEYRRPTLENSYSISVEDNGKEVLRSSDIINLNFKGYCIDLYADESFYSLYDNQTVTNLRLCINGETIDIECYFFEENSDRFIHFFASTDNFAEDKKSLWEFAFGYATEPYTGAVNVDLIEHHLLLDSIS